MPAKPVPVVKEKQIWKDNDPRRPSRLLEVLYVEPLKYVMFSVKGTKKTTKVAWRSIEQSSAKKGYSLVAEPAPAAEATPAPISAPESTPNV